MSPHFHLHHLTTSITDLKTSFAEYKVSRDQYNESFFQTIQILKMEIHALRNPNADTSSTITTQETHPHQHPTTPPCLPSQVQYQSSPSPPSGNSEVVAVSLTPIIPFKPAIVLMDPGSIEPFPEHFAAKVILTQINMAIERVTEHGVSNLLASLPPPAIPPPEPPDRFTILPYDRASVQPPPEPPDSKTDAAAGDTSSTKPPWWNRTTEQQIVTTVARLFSTASILSAIGSFSRRRRPRHDSLRFRFRLLRFRRE